MLILIPLPEITLIKPFMPDTSREPHVPLVWTPVITKSERTVKSSVIYYLGSVFFLHIFRSSNIKANQT